MCLRSPHSLTKLAGTPNELQKYSKINDMFCFSLIRMQTALVSEKTKHYTLLLAFDFITHEVPDILVQGLVLGLLAEVNLIL